MNIVSLFEGTVRKYPDKAMLRHAGQTYTYAQIDDLSRRGATVLAQHGIAAGDRMAVMSFNTPGFVIAILAAWRLGAVNASTWSLGHRHGEFRALGDAVRPALHHALVA